LRDIAGGWRRIGIVISGVNCFVHVRGVCLVIGTFRGVLAIDSGKENGKGKQEEFLHGSMLVWRKDSSDKLDPRVLEYIQRVGWGRRAEGLAVVQRIHGRTSD